MEMIVFVPGCTRIVSFFVPFFAVTDIFVLSDAGVRVGTVEISVCTRVELCAAFAVCTGCGTDDTAGAVEISAGFWLGFCIGVSVGSGTGVCVGKGVGDGHS